MYRPSWLSPLTLYVLAAFLVLCLVFVNFPEIDVWVSSAVFDEDKGGFYLSRLGIVQFSYVFFAKLGAVLVLFYLVWIIWSYFPNHDRRFVVRRRPAIYFLLAVLLIGPGIVTHNIFKDNWGRARPHKTVMFNGSSDFTPAWQMTDQCHLNCSFLSGHAAIGYYPLCLYFLFGKRRRYWITLGLMMGLASGLGRVLQGKHFLSDILFSFFVVYFTSSFCYELFLAKEKKFVKTRERIKDLNRAIKNGIRNAYTSFRGAIRYMTKPSIPKPSVPKSAIPMPSSITAFLRPTLWSPLRIRTKEPESVQAKAVIEE